MTYRINIAEGKGRNWNDTGLQYSHYYAVETDYEETMLKIVDDLMQIYPYPAYDITVSKSTTTSTKVFLAQNMPLNKG